MKILPGKLRRLASPFPSRPAPAPPRRGSPGLVFAVVVVAGGLVLGAILFPAVRAAGPAPVAPSAVAAPEWRAAYADLLRRYVAGPGGVRYAAWKERPADVAALQRVVDAIAQPPAPQPGSPGSLGYYLDAYNAWILHEKVNEYPRGRTQKGLPLLFFTLPRIVVGGEKMSFNRLEKDLIRARYGEPRVHFALNCGSVSCPPLAPEPYQGGDLDAKLDAATRAFVNSVRGVRPENHGQEFALSQIFQWYRDDFARSGGVLTFVNRYRETPLPAAAKLTTQPYDWSLNEAAPGR